jgi:hypothetical protein
MDVACSPSAAPLGLRAAHKHRLPPRFVREPNTFVSQQRRIWQPQRVWLWGPNKAQEKKFTGTIFIKRKGRRLLTGFLIFLGGFLFCFFLVF